MRGDIAAKFSRCRLEQPNWGFAECIKIEMDNCDYACCSSTFSAASMRADDLIIKNSVIHGERDNEDSDIRAFSGGHIITLESCIFKSITAAIHIMEHKEINLSVRDCFFDDCEWLCSYENEDIECYGTFLIDNSRFDNNSSIDTSFAKGEIMNCEFQSCECAISMLEGHIEKCKFHYCETPIIHEQAEAAIDGQWIDGKHGIILEDCVFTECTELELRLYYSRVQNCSFIGCQQPIFDSDCKGTIIRKCTYKD